MAYNPYDAVSRIFNLKGEWDNANSSGNAEQTAKIAQDAQGYYQQLRNNGFGTVADQLSSSNYEQSKSIYDKYAKTGNTEFRPYMYSLGSKYGLSQTDMDKLIQWDDGTGEISFAGKKIGQPFSVVDGKSYIQDTSMLDNAFNEYAGRSGLTRATSSMVNQENESLFKKYNDEYDYLTKTNPLETETAKSILERYDLKGLQGRDNEVASGSSTNSGNIDSFSAANALRQQASLRNMGEQTALSAHQQRLQNAQSLLSQMGININNVFNQDQTAQNNEVARDTQKTQNDLAVAETFGKATSNQYTNSYIGKDMDFKAAYDQAKQSGASTEVLNQLAEARFMKQVAANDFSAGFIPFEPTSKETANMLLTNKQIESAERMASGDNATNQTIASGNNQNALDQINAQTQAQKDLLAEQVKYKTTNTSTNTTLPAEFKPKLTAAQSESAVKSGKVSQSVVDDYNYWHGTNYTTGNVPTSGSTASGSATTPTDEKVNVVNFNTLDTTGVKAYGVDQYGMNLLNKLQTEAINKGGFLTEKEIFEIAVNTSDDNNTNLAQIKKVYGYLGLDTSPLDSGVSDSGVFAWNFDWGVKAK